MHPLNEYITGSRETLSRRDLDRIIEQHEWFSLARRVRVLATGDNDPALILPLAFRATVPPVNKSHPMRLQTTSPANEKADTGVIDRFIEHGGYRIIPTDEAGDVNVDVDIDPDMVSEQLAEIYRAQGFTEKANEIYERLNLHNS